MNLILMGPQGCGKGTQAKFLSTEYKLVHISAGDLLRNAQGELKKEIDSFINKGILVPNELIIKLIQERIKQPDCKNGFILDGFPRTVEQAKALDKAAKIDIVLEITLPDQEAISRISSRLSCPKCGTVFNTITNPPKKNGICDKCGAKLIIRDDDKEEAIKKRLKSYHEQTEVIKTFYPEEKMITIDGNSPINQVWENIKVEIKNKKI